MNNYCKPPLDLNSVKSISWIQNFYYFTMGDIYTEINVCYVNRHHITSIDQVLDIVQFLTNVFALTAKVEDAP